MESWINDDFPFDELECQYMNICRKYQLNSCAYDASCKLRQSFRKVIEKYVPNSSLDGQVESIINEETR